MLELCPRKSTFTVICFFFLKAPMLLAIVRSSWHGDFSTSILLNLMIKMIGYYRSQQQHLKMPFYLS